MVSSLGYNLVLNLKNIPGWHTSRKIVVIECDDWGGIRIPSGEIYEKLLRAALPVTRSGYRYDTLETADDLERLFDVLESIKDKNGNSAVMTPVSNVANPDFEKIKNSDFTEYHYEKFTDTLLKYGRGEGVFKLWEQGIESNIFVPELHGREHISVQFWLKKLREGSKDLMLAFDNGLVSLDIPGIPAAIKEFRPEFYFNSEDQKPFLKNSLEEGIDLFSEIFGYLPRAFVPANSIFHPDFEKILSAKGIKYLYVNHSSPVPDANGNIRHKHYISGQQNSNGLTYYTRNCAFEPTAEGYSGLGLTMKQIAAAFRWGKPANISTHRVNFVGGINTANRDKGLKELSELLRTIVKMWPEAEFMSSGDALEFMRKSN
jgi:hypothetical protein